MLRGKHFIRLFLENRMYFICHPESLSPTSCNELVNLPVHHQHLRQLNLLLEQVPPIGWFVLEFWKAEPLKEQQINNVNHHSKDGGYLETLRVGVSMEVELSSTQKDSNIQVFSPKRDHGGHQDLFLRRPTPCDLQNNCLCPPFYCKNVPAKFATVRSSWQNSHHGHV